MNSIALAHIENSFSFYNNLTDSQKEIIKSGANIVKYDKGSFRSKESSQCQGLISILKGQMRVYMMSDEGKEITLFRLLPGDVCVLTASCVIKNITFEIFFGYEQDTEVLLIPTYIVESLKNENNFVENYILELVSGRFSEVMWIMEKVVFSSMTKRLCEYLLEQAALQGLDIIHITHANIANELGTAREVISRLLKYLQNDGAIIQSRGEIQIINRKLLSKY